MGAAAEGMASLDIYNDILQPWQEILDGDGRIGGRDIKVIYTRREPRELDMNLMPYIAYFLEPGWLDDGIGTGSYSPQSRHVTIRIGFLLAMMGQDAGKLDKDLFLIGGDLLDVIYAHRNFNGPKSIVINGNIIWDFDATGVETGETIGTQKIVIPMDQFANFG